MAANQAAWLDKAGARLRVAASDMPQPGADEIVVKNGAVAVNPVDWKVQEYGIIFPPERLPAVLGCDVAGEVVALGSNVTRFKVGDRVAAHAMSLVTHQPGNGGLALYTAVPTSSAAVLPATISYTAGSVLPLAIDTAGVGLYAAAPKGLGLPYPSLTPAPSGTTLVVWGGSSSVGALATQLATGSGAHVVAVASARNFDFCKRCGARSVFDYNSDSVAADVAAAVTAAGGKFGGVYDAISLPESYPSVLAIMEKLGGGMVVTTLPPPEEKPANVQFSSLFGIDKVNDPLWEQYVTPALEQGKLQCLPEPLVVGRSLDAAQAGLDANKKGVSAKKVVIEL